LQSVADLAGETGAVDLGGREQVADQIDLGRCEVTSAVAHSLIRLDQAGRLQRVQHLDQLVQAMPGAQLRYLVHAAGHIVAALGFGASAWKVKPRDQVIGWTTDQRQRNLHRLDLSSGDPTWRRKDLCNRKVIIP
jgi:hypothetical protein